MRRGDSLNNPCNVKRVTGVTWHGQSAVQPDATLLAFDTPAFGYRCARRTFRTYVERDGVPSTVTSLIERFAPPDPGGDNNNTAAYIADVSKRIGVAADDAIDLDDDATAVAFLTAVTWHEQGEFIFTVTDIREGLSLERPNA